MYLGISLSTFKFFRYNSTT